MLKSVAQLIAEFNVDSASLPQEFVSAINAEISDAHSALQNAQRYKSEGEQARQAAREEKARIDAAIAAMGDSSLDNTKLKAQNKAFRAMVESLKADGLDLDLPADLMTEPKGGDMPPVNGAIPRELHDRMALMGQGVAAATIAAQYVGLTGEPLPEDMQTMVTNANRAGKTVQQYAEERYKLSEKVAERNRKAEEKRTAELHKKWEEDYKKTHPVTTENPFQRAGVDTHNAGRFSPFAKRKPEDSARSFAGLADMEKLRRAREHGLQMLAAQNQEQ
jgi:hypothetical protein